jgi:hypothetical protein
MHNNPVSFREHRELGEVAWLRDHDRGLAVAAGESKPVMLLFQEIPGCSTCVRFGQDVLTHPLMVELIADRFVPVAIFNNRPGADADILRRYGEPSWNNPVVRFLGPDGAELLPKLADRYDALGLHEKITAVLEMLGGDVPGYFRLLGRDLAVDYGLSKCATYATPCFWSGETSLAQHPSVITTDAGWVNGEEAVRVQFDPSASSREDLDAFARKRQFRARLRAAVLPSQESGPSPAIDTCAAYSGQPRIALWRFARRCAEPTAVRMARRSAAPAVERG